MRRWGGTAIVIPGPPDPGPGRGSHRRAAPGAPNCRWKRRKKREGCYRAVLHGCDCRALAGPHQGAAPPAGRPGPAGPPPHRGGRAVLPPGRKPALWRAGVCAGHRPGRRPRLHPGAAGHPGGGLSNAAGPGGVRPGCRRKPKAGKTGPRGKPRRLSPRAGFLCGRAVFGAPGAPPRRIGGRRGPGPGARRRRWKICKIFADGAD